MVFFLYPLYNISPKKQDIFPEGAENAKIFFNRSEKTEGGDLFLL